MDHKARLQELAELQKQRLLTPIELLSVARHYRALGKTDKAAEAVAMSRRRREEILASGVEAGKPAIALRPSVEPIPVSDPVGMRPPVAPAYPPEPPAVVMHSETVFAQVTTVETTVEVTRSSNGIVGVIVALFILCGGFAGLGNLFGGSTGAGILSSASYSVRYEVTGSGTPGATVTLAGPASSQSQYDVALPWSTTCTMDAGEFAYIAAQNAAEYGRIHVTIYVDGEPWRSSDASGAYSIASASGSVGER